MESAVASVRPNRLFVGAILGPADNYGGRAAFRYILPFTGALILIFGWLYSRDRRAGGYRATRLGVADETG